VKRIRVKMGKKKKKENPKCPHQLETTERSSGVCRLRRCGEETTRVGRGSKGEGMSNFGLKAKELRGTLEEVPWRGGET